MYLNLKYINIQFIVIAFDTSDTRNLYLTANMKINY